MMGNVCSINGKRVVETLDARRQRRVAAQALGYDRLAGETDCKIAPCVKLITH